jgi:hypothetical protein
MNKPKSSLMMDGSGADAQEASNSDAHSSLESDIPLLDPFQPSLEQTWSVSNDNHSNDRESTDQSFNSKEQSVGTSNGIFFSINYQFWYSLKILFFKCAPL